jgi:hypothetical protein
MEKQQRQSLRVLWVLMLPPLPQMLLMLLLQVALLLPLLQIPLLAALSSFEELRRLVIEPLGGRQLHLASAWAVDRASWESGRFEKEVLLMLPSLLQVPVLVLLIQVPPLRALLLCRLVIEPLKCQQLRLRPRRLASAWTDDRASSGAGWIEKEGLPMPPALLLVLLLLLLQLPLQVLLLQAPLLAALPSSAELRRPAVETLKGQQPSLQPLAFASAVDHASWGSEWIEKQGRLLQPE